MRAVTSHVVPSPEAGIERSGSGGPQGSDGPEPERAWKRILEFYRARLGK